MASRFLWHTNSTINYDAVGLLGFMYLPYKVRGARDIGSSLNFHDTFTAKPGSAPFVCYGISLQPCCFDMDMYIYVSIIYVEIDICIFVHLFWYTHADFSEDYSADAKPAGLEFLKGPSAASIQFDTTSPVPPMLHNSWIRPLANP